LPRTNRQPRSQQHRDMMPSTCLRGGGREWIPETTGSDVCPNEAAVGWCLSVN
jgi:hypothetical protein